MDMYNAIIIGFRYKNIKIYIMHYYRSTIKSKLLVNKKKHT